MNKSHAVEGLTLRANCWLSNTPTINLYRLGGVAHIAREESCGGYKASKLWGIVALQTLVTETILVLKMKGT